MIQLFIRRHGHGLSVALGAGLCLAFPSFASAGETAAEGQPSVPFHFAAAELPGIGSGARTSGLSAGGSVDFGTNLGRAGELPGVGTGSLGPERWSQQLGGEISGPATHYNRSAILTSLLLPGLAQYRLGEKERGLAFMGVELALWTGFASFRIQGENREDSYIEMAELFAGISPEAPRDEDFYKTLAGWPSSDLYNEIVVRRLARTEGGDDLAAREAYYEENRIQGDETWDWDSEVARTDFREKRSDAQRSFKRSRYMIGLTVVNRVVAMIDAVLLSGRAGGSNYGLEMTQSRSGTEYAARLGLRRTLP